MKRHRPSDTGWIEPNATTRCATTREDLMNDARVLVADDHPLITQGLLAELQARGVAEAQAVSEAAQVLPAYERMRPTLLILDLRFGQVRGLHLVRKVLEADPAANIVVYTQFDQDPILREAYRLGVRALVPKSTDIMWLFEAVANAAIGKLYFVPSVAERMARISVRGEESPRAKLSDRQFEAFLMMARGYTQGEIAQALQLSAHTITALTQKVREKLGVQRPIDLTRLAIRYELLDAD